MLDHDPGRRPTAKQLMIRTTGYDLSHRIGSNHSIFGECCRSDFISTKENEQKFAEVTVLRAELLKARELSQKQAQDFTDRIQQEVARANELTAELEERRKENRALHVARNIAKVNQDRSKMEYDRDRDVWLQEKSELKDRLREKSELKDQLQEKSELEIRRVSEFAAKVKYAQLDQLREKLAAAEKSSEEKQTELNDLFVILGDMEEKRSKDKVGSVNLSATRTSNADLMQKRLRDLGENVSDSEEEDSTDEEDEDDQGT